MKIEKLEVAGIGPAIFAMRNPMTSYEKADSTWEYLPGQNDDLDVSKEERVTIGPADKELSIKLQKNGPEHSKHLRMVMVWADIYAPLFW